MRTAQFENHEKILCQQCAHGLGIIFNTNMSETTAKWIDIL